MNKVKILISVGCAIIAMGLEINCVFAETETKILEPAKHKVISFQGLNKGKSCVKCSTNQKIKQGSILIGITTKKQMPYYPLFKGEIAQVLDSANSQVNLCPPPDLKDIYIAISITSSKDLQIDESGNQNAATVTCEMATE